MNKIMDCLFAALMVTGLVLIIVALFCKSDNNMEHLFLCGLASLFCAMLTGLVLAMRSSDPSGRDWYW